MGVGTFGKTREQNLHVEKVTTFCCVAEILQTIKKKKNLKLRKNIVKFSNNNNNNNLYVRTKVSDFASFFFEINRFDQPVSNAHYT